MSSADPFSLRGAVALAVGGTSGIGREIALGFARSGARVIPVSRTAAKVEAVTREIREAGGEAHGYTADACRLKEIEDVVKRVEADHGRIDILLNSQGMTRIKPAVDFTEDDFDTIVDTNLKSVFFMSTAVARGMLARGSGAILNIASLSSFRGWGNSAVYALTKWGVVSLTQTMAREWASRGVRVNAIAPGFFLTDLNRTVMSEERKAEAVRRTPMARFGELHELVGAAIYLVSPAASFVTGATLPVDGGYLAAGI
jgi:NAD(P)-dependent dehydrogenase (short-subunit alcohol dehydrogenase family)